MAVEGAGKGLAKAVVESIDNELASFGFGQLMMICEAREEFEKLQDTLSMVKALLMDAEEQQNLSLAAKQTIQLLKRKFLLEAEDIIDDFLTRDLRKTVLRGMRGRLGQVQHFFSSPFLRLDLSYKIKVIRERFNEVKDGIVGLDSIQRFNPETKIDRQTDSYVIASEIIGRDKTKEDIINLLLQSHDKENVSSVAVIGIGGLGKTALAQLVFNDDKVISYFKKKMWVCVSEDFQVELLLRKILKEGLTEKDVDKLELNQLGQELREKISGQRYLLVLDDIWNEDFSKWDSLRKHLMSGALGSKILITTRSTGVADTMKIDQFFRHNLEGLGEKESWDLFETLAYTDDSKKNRNILKIGEKIALKCRGVPLVIRTIASSLQRETRESNWSKTMQDIDTLVQNSEEIMPTLKLSYHKLPIELRQCLAYCSVFPKGYEINKPELIQLWMAQGYLGSPTGNKCLEDVGAKYVDDLIMRSFFQNDEKDKYGNVKRFKMHDLIHDLVHLVTDREFCVPFGKGKVPGNPVHVSIESESFDVKDLLSVKWLKSFLRLTDSRIYNLDCIKFFRSLRAFYLPRYSVPEHAEIMPCLNSLHKLQHLRYLNLSENKSLTSLPDGICKLINLQTLKLDGCKKLEKLPQGIAKLINLRCLSIKRCDSLSYIPAGVGKLESLHSLSNFIVGKEPRDCAKLNILKGLTNLSGKVRIHNLDLVRDVVSESQEANLDEMRFLHSLSLSWDPLADVDADLALQLSENLKPYPNLQGLKLCGYPGLEFPKWISYYLKSLVRLRLEDVSNCKYIPPLNQLQSLECLQIHYMRALKYVLYDDGPELSCGSSDGVQFFPSLKELIILKCDKLIGWKRLQGDNGTSNKMHQTLMQPTFPRLTVLNVRRCPKLTGIPFYPSVEKLGLEGPILNSFTETMMMNGTQGVAAVATEIDSLPSISSGISKTSSTASALLAPLSKLKVIYLYDDYCDAKPIPEEGMKNVTSLEILDVKKFRFLGSLVRQFKYLTALWYLEIDGDDCDTDIDWDALGSLCSLQQLSLKSCNTLRIMPDSFCNLTSLRSISISSCRNLPTLPDSIRRLTSLQKLYIESVNKMSLLECVGCNLPSLSVLFIRDFETMQSLPESIRGLTKLRILIISDCHNFETLPEWIGELTSLIGISIRYCGSIKSIPEGMRHLTNLETLIIHNSWEHPDADRDCADSWRVNGHREKVAHVKDVALSWERRKNR